MECEVQRALCYGSSSSLQCWSTSFLKAEWAALVALPVPSESLEHGSYMYVSANDRVYVPGVFARQQLTLIQCKGGKSELPCLNLSCVHGGAQQHPGSPMHHQ